MRQIPFGLKQDCQFNEGQLKNELSSSALVMLDNPHIPTIRGFPRKTLLSLIDDNLQTCLMIDESDLAFVDLDSSNNCGPHNSSQSDRVENIDGIPRLAWDGSKLLGYR